MEDKEYFEVKIIDIFAVLKEAWKLILLITFLGFLYSLYAAMSATKIYYSNSVLTASEVSSFSSASQNRGNSSSSIIQLLSNAPSSSKKSEVVIKYLSSRDFFRILYSDDIFLKQLMYSKSYDLGSNKLNFFDFDPESRPSFEKSYEAYLGNVIVSNNSKTGFTEILTKHMSPYVAQSWNQTVIDQINSYQKDKEISEAEKSLEFYRTKLQNSPNIQSLKSVYAAGMTNDLQVLSMASKTDEFAFTIIDSPFFPERASEPSRRLILMLGTIISVIVSFVITLLLYYLNRNLYLKYSKLKIF